MQLNKIEKSFNFIIFGASGDLAQLKIFPSIYELALQGRFNKQYSITGFARSKMTDEEFRKSFSDSVKKHVDKKLFNQKVLDELLSNTYYHQGQYDEVKSFGYLADKLLEHHKSKKVYNLAYLAVPPSVFSVVSKNLSLIKSEIGEIQVMMEKPFGEDRKSAGELFKEITSHMSPSDLYLIDHYLGKAPVQSILPLRYNNTILNLLLNGGAIANIQISALEQAGLKDRIGYFDKVGIVKDMIQSHLFQVLALLTMRMPVRPDVHSIRREKGNIISALRYDDSDCGVALGQYESYKKLDGVEQNSKTPTFAAFRFFIDLSEWYKVPIYVRTGKKLTHKHTYIVVEFEKPPFQKDNKDLAANRLIIELYPHEEIEIRLVNDIGKVSGRNSELITQESLACSGEGCLPSYGQLILDAFLGNNNSFLSIDEILASWHFIDSIMECMEKRNFPISTYKDDGLGPKEQFNLTEQDGFEWFDPDLL